MTGSSESAYDKLCPRSVEDTRDCGSMSSPADCGSESILDSGVGSACSVRPISLSGSPQTRLPPRREGSVGGRGSPGAWWTLWFGWAACGASVLVRLLVVVLVGKGGLFFGE